jgi:hypothetical protein
MLTISVLLALAGMLVAAQVVAKEGDQASAEMQQMMQKWMAFATPGAPHQHLAERAGSWSFRTHMWEYPGAEPTESMGASTARMVMDGRYLIDETEGSFQGMPFNGMGITGYDNLNQQYFAIWIDNMGTGVMIAHGKADESGKVITFEAESPDPISGINKKYKLIERTVDADQWVMEMYNDTPDGKEYLHFEIKYERRQ